MLEVGDSLGCRILLVFHLWSWGLVHVLLVSWVPKGDDFGVILERDGSLTLSSGPIYSTLCWCDLSGTGMSLIPCMFIEF